MTTARKQEIAERLAATVDERVSVELVQRIIAEYLTQLSATTPCPGCDETGGRPTHDPDWVSWRCMLGESVARCQQDRSDTGKDRSERHQDCGWRVMLPLPPVRSGVEWLLPALRGTK